MTDVLCRPWTIAGVYRKFGGYLVVIHTPTGLLSFFDTNILKAVEQSYRFIFWRSRPHGECDRTHSGVASSRENAGMS